MKGGPYESGKGKTGINHTNVRNGTVKGLHFIKHI
jgi:hypothetical protein